MTHMAANLRILKDIRIRINAPGQIQCSAFPQIFSKKTINQEPDASFLGKGLMFCSGGIYSLGLRELANVS